MPILGVTASSISGHLFTDTGVMFPLGMVQVGSAGAADITFNSIPSTYTHLQIRVTARTTTATSFDAIALQFNGETSSVYTLHTILGNGSSVVGFASTPETSIYLDKAGGASLGSNIFAAIVCDILDYKSTSKFKTTRSLGGVDNNGSGVIHLTSGLWRSTNAVSSIKLYAYNGGNFAQYTSIALYGIKGA